MCEFEDDIKAVEKKLEFIRNIATLGENAIAIYEKKIINKGELFNRLKVVIETLSETQENLKVLWEGK